MCRYSEEIKQTIWEDALVVDGYDQTKYRKDPCGAWIIRDKYGLKDSQYGWEIDHIIPQSLLEKAGVPIEVIDNVLNLRAMNWKNNESKSDDYPVYHACFSSEGNTNIIKEEDFEVAEDKQEELKKLFQGYDLSL